MKHLVEFLSVSTNAGRVFSDADLLQIMQEGKYDTALCSSALRLIKDQASIVSLLRPFSRKDVPSVLMNMLIPCLKLKKKTYDELHKLGRDCNFHDRFCVAIIPFLKLETKKGPELLRIMEDFKYEFHICEAVFPFLKVKNKKESWRWSVVESAYFNRVVCRLFIPYLSAAHALIVMERYNYTNSIAALGIKRLKKNADIVDVIKKSKFDSDVCERIDTLKSEGAKMDLIFASNWNVNICTRILPTLKQKANIKIAFEMCKNNFHLARLLFPFCKDEEQIMSILHLNGDSWHFCEDALPFLKDENNLFFVLEHLFFEDEALAYVVKKLRLKRKKEDKLWSLMEKVKWNAKFCALVIPYLHLENKTETELMEILKQKKFPEGLCCAMIPFLKEDDTLLTLFSKIHLDENAKVLIVSKLSQEGRDTYFSRDHHSITIRMIPLLSEDVLFEKMKAGGYKEDFCRELTEFLRRKAEKKV